MFFLDLAAIVYFIFLAPVPIFSGLFQANPTFWKRFGYWIFVMPLTFWVATTLLVFRFLGPFIENRFPQSPVTVVLGLLIACIGLVVTAFAVQTLSLTTLISLPQIDPKRYPSKLTTAGIYGRVRHPRYLSFWLMGFGLALATGFTAMWLLFLWSLVGLMNLGYLEEQELQERFGNAYREYMKKVPRFFPRLLK